MAIPPRDHRVTWNYLVMIIGKLGEAWDHVQGVQGKGSFRPTLQEAKCTLDRQLPGSLGSEYQDQEFAAIVRSLLFYSHSISEAQEWYPL